MKTDRHQSALLLVATFLVIITGCYETVRVNTPRTQMTVREARKSLTEALTRVNSIKSVQEVKFSRRRIKFVANDMAYNWATESYENVAGQEPVTFSIDFFNLKDVYVEMDYKFRYDLFSSPGLTIQPFSNCNFSDSKYWASRARDSLLVLRDAALAPDTEETDFATFTTSATAWLAETSKPTMSDDALTYKALAEDAFKRKDFAAALDAYCSALDRHPMWPEGHYNAALLAAEVEDYELATMHMRRYLILAPDAKDLALAKEKFLLWQHKAKDEGGQ